MFRTCLLAGTAGLLLLTGCSLDVGRTLGLAAAPPKPMALAVGDEPYAVQVGASVLAQGGSAADAATAMYFALSVTYPVAASLGGGGICLVHDPVRATNEEFDFLARDASGGGAFAVPGAVRGFAMLQNAYGAIPWQKDVSPAEGYARAGFPISAALDARLAAAADVIRLDAGLAAEFLDESGQVKRVGSVVANTALADTLAAIRTNGPDAFYTGAIAQKIAAYSAGQGGAITAAELAAYAPLRGAPRAVTVGNDIVFTPNERTGAGAFAGKLLDHLVQASQMPDGAANPEAAVIASVQTALKDFNITALPKDLGATGFAATDRSGQAVACAVTMNGPFGSGHTADNTGVTLARAPSAVGAGLAAAFLTPMIASHAASGPITLAGAGAGGPNGSAAIAYALERIAHGERILDRKDLHSTGVAPYDTVNAIVCQDGICAVLPDPAAHGLGAAAAEAE